MRATGIGRATGSIALKERKRGGPQWYAHYRLVDGRQVQRRLGPAWTERGRPLAGYYTRKTAQDALRAILTDAERGTLAGSIKTGATFGDAVAEWLRYVEQDRKRRPSTVGDYRNLAHGSLLPEFGAETPLEAIDTDRIDAYRARLVAEGRLSDRTINKLLVALHGSSGGLSGPTGCRPTRPPRWSVNPSAAQAALTSSRASRWRR